MDLLEHIDKVLEGGLQRVVEHALGSRGSVEFLEAYEAALEQVAAQARVIGSRRTFPYRHVTLVFGVAATDQIPAIERTLSHRRLLLNEVRRRLEATGCESVRPLFVEARAVPGGDALLQSRPFLVQFAADLPPQPALSLTVLNGPCEVQAEALTQAVVNIGRTRQVNDDRRRLVRVNHVVFGDSGVGAGVSRLHAHITFDSETGLYRLYDDQSTLGTRIRRGDRLIDVPSGPQAGAWLQSGDGIHLGEAILSVAVAPRT